MRARLAAGALGLALACGVALAQDDPPRAAPLAADPLAPPAPAEEALRGETGRLLARLVREKTLPAAEEALLQVEVDERGRLFGQTRVVEVSVRRHERGEDLRLRFREPAELRGRAWLLLADGRAYAYDPARRRAERVPPLEPGWRVGGGGLLLRDLRAPAWGLGDDPWTHVHLRDERLLPPGDAQAAPGAADDEAPGRAVHVVRSTPPGGGGAREAWIDRERHVPWVVFERDAQDRVAREVRASDWRPLQGRLRPFALEVAEPGAERVTRVVVRARSASAPALRFDPARFRE